MLPLKSLSHLSFFKCWLKFSCSQQSSLKSKKKAYNSCASRAHESLDLIHRMENSH